MTDARCEPPEEEELRGVDGWHWIQAGDNPAVCWRWTSHGKYWQSTTAMSVRQATSYGYRYLSPVATPAEVEALRRERNEARAEASEWCQKVQLFDEVAHRRKNERDAIGIAFTKLSAVLRVNMLRHVPGTSHAEIDAAIDACLGPVARAALAKEVGDAT